MLMVCHSRRSQLYDPKADYASGARVHSSAYSEPVCNFPRLVSTVVPNSAAPRRASVAACCLTAPIRHAHKRLEHLLQEEAEVVADRPPMLFRGMGRRRSRRHGAVEALGATVKLPATEGARACALAHIEAALATVTFSTSGRVLIPPVRRPVRRGMLVQERTLRVERRPPAHIVSPCGPARGAQRTRCTAWVSLRRRDAREGLE